MKAFIDTSTLVKKYVEESGSEAFSEILEQINDIVVAPTYLIELTSAIQRKSLHNEIFQRQISWLLTEAKKDLNYFVSVRWSDDLVQRACRLIHAYNLKTLDAIQLSSAVLSKSDIFVTSDKVLSHFAEKELEKVCII